MGDNQTASPPALDVIQFFHQKLAHRLKTKSSSLGKSNRPIPFILSSPKFTANSVGSEFVLKSASGIADLRVHLILSLVVSILSGLRLVGYSQLEVNEKNYVAFPATFEVWEALVHAMEKRQVGRLKWAFKGKSKKKNPRWWYRFYDVESDKWYGDRWDKLCPFHNATLLKDARYIATLIRYEVGSPHFISNNELF